MRKPRGKDTPYDSLTGRGGEKLAQEVYYHTNISTAAEFAAWWKEHGVQKPPVETKTVMNVPRDIHAMAEFYCAIQNEPANTRLAAVNWLAARIRADIEAGVRDA